MTTRGSLRVALVGSGDAGRTFHAPLMGVTPGMRLAVVASGNAGKLHGRTCLMSMVWMIRSQT